MYDPLNLTDTETIELFDYVSGGGADGFEVFVDTETGRHWLGTIDPDAGLVEVARIGRNAMSGRLFVDTDDYDEDVTQAIVDGLLNSVVRATAIEGSPSRIMVATPYQTFTVVR